eukprot:370195_1
MAQYTTQHAPYNVSTYDTKQMLIQCLNIQHNIPHTMQMLSARSDGPKNAPTTRIDAYDPNGAIHQFPSTEYKILSFWMISVVVESITKTPNPSYLGPAPSRVSYTYGPRFFECPYKAQLFIKAWIQMEARGSKWGSLEYMVHLHLGELVQRPSTHIMHAICIWTKCLYVLANCGTTDDGKHFFIKAIDLVKCVTSGSSKLTTATLINESVIPMLVFYSIVKESSDGILRVVAEELSWMRHLESFIVLARASKMAVNINGNGLLSKFIQRITAKKQEQGTKKRKRSNTPDPSEAIEFKSLPSPHSNPSEAIDMTHQEYTSNDQKVMPFECLISEIPRVADQARHKQEIHEMLMIAFAFIPVIAIYNIVLDKTKLAKHRFQQMVWGISFISYCIGNFVADCIAAIAVLVIVYVLVHAFGVDVYLSEAQGAFLLVLIVFTMSILPFTYILSYLFAAPDKAQTVMSTIYLILGMILSIVSFVHVLQQINPQTKDINGAFMNVYRIFPTFLMADSLCTFDTLVASKISDGHLYFQNKSVKWHDLARESCISFHRVCKHYLSQKKMTTSMKQKQMILEQNKTLRVFGRHEFRIASKISDGVASKYFQNKSV